MVEKITEEIPLSEIVANPYRSMDKHTIREDKIDALTKSVERSGFWRNVIGRRENGKVQLAYGHHRWITFQRKYGKDSKMPINIEDLSDDDMIIMMANENMQEWGTNAKVEQETVEAVVLAYAEGKIKLGKPGALEKDENGKIKGGVVYSAPSFLKYEGDMYKVHNAYTAWTISDYLGWVQPNGEPSIRIRNALVGLEAIENELVKKEDFIGLGSSQAVAVIKEGKKIQKTYEKLGEASKSELYKEQMKKEGEDKAKKAMKEATEKMREEADKTSKAKSFGMRQVIENMQEVRAEPTMQERVPTLKDFIRTLSRDLDDTVGPKDKNWGKIKEVLKFQEHLDSNDIENLVESLKRVQHRCQVLLDVIESNAIEGSVPEDLIKKLEGEVECQSQIM